MTLQTVKTYDYNNIFKLVIQYSLYVYHFISMCNVSNKCVLNLEGVRSKVYLMCNLCLFRFVTNFNYQTHIVSVNCCIFFNQINPHNYG